MGLFYFFTSNNDPEDVRTLRQVFASPWANAIDLKERHSQLVTIINNNNKLKLL